MPHRPEDRFYNPRDAKLVNAGDGVLLIDDGNNRPGCTTTYERHCYSRAMHYKLNFDTMVAEVIWQVCLSNICARCACSQRSRFNRADTRETVRI